MRNLSLLFALSLLFSSCGVFTFDNPEMKGKENIDITKIKGRTIDFTVDATIFNPNWYGLKVKPSVLDLYVEGEYMGKVHLNEKLKMKGNRDTDLKAVFTAELSKGALLRAMKFALKKEIKVQLKGEVKGGVFFFSKKFDFNETKTVPGASFKLRN